MRVLLVSQEQVSQEGMARLNSCMFQTGLFEPTEIQVSTREEANDNAVRLMPNTLVIRTDSNQDAMEIATNMANSMTNAGQHKMDVVIIPTDSDWVSICIIHIIGEAFDRQGYPSE